MEQKKENMQLIGFTNLVPGKYGNIEVTEKGVFYDFGNGVRVKVSALYRNESGEFTPILDFKWLEEKPRATPDPNRAALLASLDSAAEKGTGDM